MRYDETRIPEAYDAGRGFEPAARATWVGDLQQRLTEPPQRCLDVGCGTGRFTLTVRDAFPTIGRLVGMDLSRLMLKQAERKPEFEHLLLVRGRAESLPFASGSFDLVVISMVYHQLQSTSAAIGEVHRVLTRSGRFYLRSPTQETFRGCHWATSFPRAAQIARRTLPYRTQLLSQISSLGFHATSSGPVRFVLAPAPDAYLRKLGQRAISSFRELSDREIESGMRTLRDELERLDFDSPIEEEVDAFCFQVG